MEVGPVRRYWFGWNGIGNASEFRAGASGCVEMKCAADAGAVGAARREGAERFIARCTHRGFAPKTYIVVGVAR